MVTREPSEKELKQALEYIDKLHANPKELEKWANKVIDGWLKRKHYRRS